MADIVVGYTAVDELCEALGIPGGLSVQSVVLRADVGGLATVGVEFVPTEDQMAALGEWMKVNRDRLLIDPALAVGRKRGEQYADR